jgi:hypothetical protein
MSVSLNQSAADRAEVRKALVPATITRHIVPGQSDELNRFLLVAVFLCFLMTDSRKSSQECSKKADLAIAPDVQRDRSSINDVPHNYGSPSLERGPMALETPDLNTKQTIPTILKQGVKKTDPIVREWSWSLSE